jgi:succinyl-CoA synthetase beta subunit
MLTPEMKSIIEASLERGWVLEPDAKQLMALAGFDVPESCWAKDIKEASAFAEKSGYPIVAKIVSPDVLHKSDVGGVAVGIGTKKQLAEVFERFSKISGFDGVLVEETLAGTELIIGCKVDEQFGPVVLLGIGGVAVEVYKDTAIRMAPLEAKDVASMISDLTARKLIEGFRGSEPVNKELLAKTVVDFSKLVMELSDDIESIDLNPVMCSSTRCAVADARIMLAR